MPEELAASARRVQRAIAAHGLAPQVVQLPATTRSAEEAARAIGCRVEQIAKSLIFRGQASGKPILVIASGRNRVDESRLAALVGEPIAKADADFVRQRTGFAIGGVPPVGHSEPMTTFLDQDLFGLEVIWAAAGTPHAVFRLTPADLQAMTAAQIAQVKSQGG
jgi:prolyl-tRNA editing enzyme YbaK/EbsC (Cys-tRNA(Pro) deacylase)